MGPDFSHNLRIWLRFLMGVVCEQVPSLGAQMNSSHWGRWWSKNGGFHEWWYPQMDSLFYGKSIYKWTIWGYLYFSKPLYVSIYIWLYIYIYIHIYIYSYIYICIIIYIYTCIYMYMYMLVATLVSSQPAPAWIEDSERKIFVPSCGLHILAWNKKMSP